MLPTLEPGVQGGEAPAIYLPRRFTPDLEKTSECRLYGRACDSLGGPPDYFTITRTTSCVLRLGPHEAPNCARVYRIVSELSSFLRAIIGPFGPPNRLTLSCKSRPPHRPQGRRGGCRD